MLKWTNRNISNEWLLLLREQIIMNFWQYFEGMTLSLKKLASFFKFQSTSILAMLRDTGSNKWFRCSDKVLANKTASLCLGFHWCRNRFRHCTRTLKYRDIAPLILLDFHFVRTGLTGAHLWQRRTPHFAGGNSKRCFHSEDASSVFRA